MKITAKLLLSLVASLSLSACVGPPQLVPVWTAKASSALPRINAAATAARDGNNNLLLFVIAGMINDTTTTNAVLAYAPAIDMWVSKANIPTARARLAAVTLNGKIYALGGEVGANAVSTVEQYDPTTDTWTPKASLLTPRKLLSAAVANGKIYVFGGENNTGALNSVEEYDSTTNTWTTKAPMPVTRANFAASTACDTNNTIYIGGSGVNNTTYAYNPINNTWTTKAPMPTSGSPAKTLESYGMATGSDGLIYAVGGDPNNLVTPAPLVYVYNPTNNTWNTGNNTNINGRFGLAVARLGNTIHAVGGTRKNTTDAILKSNDSYGSLTVNTACPTQ